MFPKFLPIFLFVSHFSSNGELIEAPPTEMGSLTECAIAKKEVERGFKGDAVERYEVECLKGVDAFKKMGYNAP